MTEKEKIIADMLKPTKAMRRAFLAAAGSPHKDPDELVPLVGTGTGDSQMVPAFENAWIVFDMDKRWPAMIDAYANELKP